MSKRRFIVPAFFYVDLDETNYPELSEREMLDAMRRDADDLAEGAQGIANEWLNTADTVSGLLLDDSPTFEIDSDGEVPYCLYDMWRAKIVEY